MVMMAGAAEPVAALARTVGQLIDDAAPLQHR